MLMQSKQPAWRQQELAQPWKGSTKPWNAPRKPRILLRLPCVRSWMNTIPPWNLSKLICRIKISFADKFDGGDDITTEQMNENLQSWVDGIQNYQQNLQRLKEATDESGQAIFSAEFVQAIQEQGTDAANMLQHMVWTLDNQGEYGVEQLKGISKKWTDAMDISEDTATVMAANKTAYELAVGELGSTDYDFSDLRESIDNAVASAVEGWAELPAATQESLMQTVQMAQECGVQIPEGLADGIASGEITPQQAIDQLNGTIEGTIQGVAEIANKAGIQIPEEIQAGINAGGTQAVSAMQELLALIQQQAADAQSAGEDVGTAVGEGTQNSIKDQQSGVEQAGGEMASAGAKAAEEKKGEYEKAGTVAAQQYQTGINSGKSGAISASGTMASQAAAAVRTYQNSFLHCGIQRGCWCSTRYISRPVPGHQRFNKNDQCRYCRSQGSSRDPFSIKEI